MGTFKNFPIIVEVKFIDISLFQFNSYNSRNCENTISKFPSGVCCPWNLVDWEIQQSLKLLEVSTVALCISFYFLKLSTPNEFSTVYCQTFSVLAAN